MLSPAKEFQRLAVEPETIRDVFLGWILPLATIWVVVRFVAALVVGISSFDKDVLGYTLSLYDLPAFALPVLIQSLFMPFVFGAVIAIAAGYFSGERDFVQGVRTAAYASTPGWLVGLVTPTWHMADFTHITPPLSLPLVIGALWCIYFLFRALPPMQKTPSGRPTLLALAATVVAMFFAWGGALVTTYNLVSSLTLEVNARRDFDDEEPIP